MKLKTLARAATLALAVAAAAPASAAFYVGDTTDGPTFNRALEGFSGLSAVGTDVAYDVYSFAVDVAGLYTISSIVRGAFADAPEWDQFLFLYQDSFDPMDALANGIASDDDFKMVGRSKFEVDLMSGTTYYLVTAGFDNEDAGEFLNLIRGPGDVVTPPIPEPGTYAMLAVGLLAIGFGVRRRSTSDTE